MKLTITSVQHNLYFSGIKTHMHAHDSPFNKPSPGCMRVEKTLQQQLIVTRGRDLNLYEILILSNTTTYKHKTFIYI